VASHVHGPGRRRIAIVAAAVAAGVLLLAASGLPASGSAAGAPGRRITVALFGDSVAESLLVPNYQVNGFAPKLARAERRFGFVPGGVGLIPAAPFAWHFNASVSYETGPSPSDGWTTLGDMLRPGFDGPSGYSAVATSPLATATAAVADPDVEILFNSTPRHCLFGVSIPGRTWVLDTYRPGPSYDAEAPVVLPPGRHVVTIHGPNCGLLSFDGVVASDPVPPGRVQVEVDNLGHAAKLPWVDFNPRVRQLLRTERYGVSVFMYGYLAELFVKGRLPRAYVDAMVARARLARATGGACVVVEPTPIEVSASAAAGTAELDRTVASRAGCRYTTALAHLWTSGAAAVRSGRLLLDGIHPTARGYTLMARALAPVLAPLIRAQLRRS
jgi:hypothetical protein